MMLHTIRHDHEIAGRNRVIHTVAGKTAVITGSASGIGAGMAEAFADAGANLFLIDVDEDGLEATANEASQRGVRAEAMVVDVSDREAMKKAASLAVEAFGRVDILCNNAGVAYAGVPLDRVPDEDWDWVIGVNLKGVINGLQAFLPEMEAHGGEGHIVNTASIGGHHVMPEWSYGVYTTTKFAVVGLSEALALDLAEKGIGVSVLSPAAVDTSIYEIGRNRPERFGGAFELGGNDDLAAALKDGMKPIEIGRWVLRAIRDNQFYLFPHPHTREFVERRHSRMMAAYDWANTAADDLTIDGVDIGRSDNR